MFFGISPGARKSWGNEIQRDEFEAVENEVGIEVMRRALKWAAENEVYRSPAICTTARKMAQEMRDKRETHTVRVGGTTWVLPAQGGGGNGNGGQRKGAR